MAARLRRSARLLLTAAIFALAQPHPAAAAVKTDVVELKNGDRITCEIKKLDRGKLTVKTDGIGTLSIEWDDIDRIASAASYDVELTSGQRAFGALSRGDAGTVLVATPSGADRLDLRDIVRLSPLGGTLWRRLDGSLSAGFNFTEANVQTQWTFDSTVSYRSRHWLSELQGDSSLTTQEDAERQTRNSLSLQTQRFMKRRWSGIGFSQFQQNEELTLELRAVLGLGVGRIMTQSNRAVVSTFGGAAYTIEKYQDSDDERVTEAVAGGRLQFFTFDGRSTNLDIGAVSFYALNRAARFRLELNASFKSDIVGDLYWSVNLFETLNSDPPTGQKSNDFGFSAAIGWSF
jgi:hypothetical protein